MTPDIAGLGQPSDPPALAATAWRLIQGFAAVLVVALVVEPWTYEWVAKGVALAALLGIVATYPLLRATTRQAETERVPVDRADLEAVVNLVERLIQIARVRYNDQPETERMAFVRVRAQVDALPLPERKNAT